MTKRNGNTLRRLVIIFYTRSATEDQMEYAVCLYKRACAHSGNGFGSTTLKHVYCLSLIKKTAVYLLLLLLNARVQGVSVRSDEIVLRVKVLIVSFFFFKNNNDNNNNSNAAL